MHLAQWGLADRLAADPAVWLCHQCNDCTVRCPRDAKPGDVMQVVRALTVAHLATPRFMGRLVGNAKTTWPLLIGLPILFWIAVLYGVHGMTIPKAPLLYSNFVPYWLIYAVFFSVTGLVSLVTMVSALRFWKLLGSSGSRSGSFVSNLIPVLIEIVTHKRFNKCEAARPRKTGHFALFWGFVGAAVTSGLLVVDLYILKSPMPLALTHPFKILGNLSAVLLVIGVVMLIANRTSDNPQVGASTAYDNFFMSVVALVVLSGCIVEIARLALEPTIACYTYIWHLAIVMTLFATFPYSKFAHFLYRTLAMVHDRMTTEGGES
jgi:quinone-modifying oxidoreductase subunit QmoC